ncbi:MAG: hypothetical protein A2Z28_06740 [Chloroflexi bacterium RBG_16_51_9]|nr:MAG: hypothetical protein A2Z28_06740 [Chloroflexi bacterium RBG_16_51_9]
MQEKDNLETRRLHSQEATEFENEVRKLVERWKYLLKLNRNVEVFAVKKTSLQNSFGVEACIAIKDNNKAILEITMLDRHPYQLEKLIVHELLHLPTLELQDKILQHLPKSTKKKIWGEVLSSGEFGWDEYMVDYWAETLVCLAHGFYPQYQAPPQDEFFNQNRRIPLDLGFIRDSETGEYKSRTLKVPMNQLPQIYENCKMSMSGLL